MLSSWFTCVIFRSERVRTCPTWIWNCEKVPKIHRTILNWLALPASGFISSWGVSTLSGWMMTVKTMRVKRVGTFLESESPRNGKMGCATGPKISAHHVRKHSLKIWMLAWNRFCLQAEWHFLYLFPFWDWFFTRLFVDKLAPPLAIILDYVGKR